MPRTRRRPAAAFFAAATAIAAVGLLAPVGAFAADSPSEGVTHTAVEAPRGCVTKREFKRVDEGDPKRTVHEIFGTNGRLGDGGAGGFDRFYPQCTPARAAAGSGCEVQVEFVVGRGGVARVEAKKYNGVCEPAAT